MPGKVKLSDVFGERIDLGDEGHADCLLPDDDTDRDDADSEPGLFDEEE